MKRTTVLDLREKKADNVKIVMVTAYDATMARLVDAAEVDMILVGDSLGMVVQGHEDTLPVTMDHMVYHCRCVSRGAKRAHLVGDLPFMSFQVSPQQALQSAGRLIKEGRVQSVKLEGGARVVAHIELLVQAGIPVVAHIGLTPQSVHAMGGFRVQGRSDEDAERLIADALQVEAAGAFCLVLEGMPRDVAAEVTQRLSIPTIGIGAGPDCDGQVLVCTDLLGFDLGFEPKFVKRYAAVETIAIDALKTFASEVRGGTFPDPEHSFHRKRPARIAKLY